MATTGFVELSWSPDQIVEDDMLQQINDNTVWLRDNMVVASIGTSASTNRVKIICGKIPLSSAVSYGGGKFTNAFASTPVPNVTLGLQMNSTYRTSMNMTKVDESGFTVRVDIFDTAGKRPKTRPTCIIHWQAMGVAGVTSE